MTVRPSPNRSVPLGIVPHSDHVITVRQFAKTGARTKRFIVALSLPKLLLYTVREAELKDNSVIMTEELMVKSKLREELFAASGF